MSGDFESIHVVLPKLLSDFENIQRSQLTSLEATRAIAKSFQERLDLYYSIVTKVEGGFAIFDSIFGSQNNESKRDIENYLSHLPKPREITNHAIFSKIVSEKTLRFATLKVPEDTTFSSLLLPATASCVWFPVIKQDKVIGIIELGSEVIMKFQKYWNDQEIIKATTLPFETLQAKINRILESCLD